MWKYVPNLNDFKVVVLINQQSQELLSTYIPNQKSDLWFNLSCKIKYRLSMKSNLKELEIYDRMVTGTNLEKI